MTSFVRSPCDEAVIACAPARGSEHSDAGASWTLATAILGSSMAFIDATVVNVALPSMQASLNATIAQIQWIGAAFTLTQATAARR